MRRWLAILLVGCSLTGRGQFLPFPGPAVATSGGGGGPNTFSDDFNRANSCDLGANWEQWGGTACINSNAYRLSTGSFAQVTTMYATSANSLTQYVKVTVGVNSQYPWLVFRGTSSTDPFYTLQLDGNNATIDWYHYADASAASGTAIGSGGTIPGGAFSVGTTLCITVDGTGASTVVRIWRACTGTPSAADNWNGDTTPDLSLTDDPGASAVDSGMQVGIGGQQGSADTVTLEDFFGGGL